MKSEIGISFDWLVTFSLVTADNMVGDSLRKPMYVTMYAKITNTSSTWQYQLNPTCIKGVGSKIGVVRPGACEVNEYLCCALEQFGRTATAASLISLLAR